MPRQVRVEFAGAMFHAAKGSVHACDTIDEFDGRSVTTQPDMAKQQTNLLTGKHDGKGLQVRSANLEKDLPGRQREEVLEKCLQASDSLPHRIGLPSLLELEKEQILTHLVLDNELGIAGKMFLEQAQLTAVSVPGAVAVVVQCQQFGETGHRLIRMAIGQRIGQLPVPQRTL